MNWRNKQVSGDAGPKGVDCENPTLVGEGE